MGHKEMLWVALLLLLFGYQTVIRVLLPCSTAVLKNVGHGLSDRDSTAGEVHGASQGGLDGQAWCYVVLQRIGNVVSLNCWANLGAACLAFG